MDNTKNTEVLPFQFDNFEVRSVLRDGKQPRVTAYRGRHFAKQFAIPGVAGKVWHVNHIGLAILCERHNQLTFDFPVLLN